ncbi:alkaline shock response membrane anchor protein AmaP [Streptomyces sp. N2-109]|uniref:Alkaline shock response membrane anchor protein AmaP n=1 Tax=Streptomyces gossypii TaxID=2883101 RepID=A0ABT2K2R3_9ACTN|nr:alkaline shock response membrane anchor protein AmaP [Streptomyces gossypii]MCT2593769.1 alkaline shock response membrane anchor protein AmaP [Streptomyces gossypii]
MCAVLRTVNRVLLGLTGALLLVAGVVVLVAGLDLRQRWGFSLGAGWRWATPDDVLLTDADRARWQDEGWWWPVVFAGLGVLLALLLWWLLAQLRRRRLGEVLIVPEESDGAAGAPHGDGPAARLRCRALEDVLAAEAESLEGVERARVRLRGRRTKPQARVSLLLAPQARPATALERLHTEALEHARTSVGLARFPAEVRLRSVRHRAGRVS